MLNKLETLSCRETFPVPPLSLMPLRFPPAYPGYLEEEACEVVKNRLNKSSPLANELGLSESGGIFLIARLKKKGRL